jgi:hypothetical protein
MIFLLLGGVSPWNNLLNGGLMIEGRNLQLIKSKDWLPESLILPKSNIFPLAMGLTPQTNYFMDKTESI